MRRHCAGELGRHWNMPLPDNGFQSADERVAHTGSQLNNVSGTPEIVFSAGIKRADMRRLLAEAITHRDAFLQEWERIHGRHV